MKFPVYNFLLFFCYIFLFITDEIPVILVPWFASFTVIYF